MNAKLSVAAAVLLSSLPAAISCHAAPPAIREVAGCYAVTIGPWVSDPRHVDQPHPPPDTLRLSTTRVTNSSVERYQVQPDAFAAGTRGATSFWARAGDSVIIEWSVAFAGVAMRVTPTADGLAGRVKSWTDRVVMDENGQVPWPSAPVRLVRSRCSKPDAA